MWWIGWPSAGAGIASTAAARVARSTIRRRRRWPPRRCWTAGGSTRGAPTCRPSSRSTTRRAAPSWPRRSRQQAAAREVAHRADPAGCSRRDVENAMAAAARVAGGQSLSDAELAELGCALSDVQVRDTLYALAVGENAGEAESLWAVLARTLPQPWRVEALVLLAFSAYARGDGPLAGVSLEAALRCDPRPSDGGHAGHGIAVRPTARADPGTGGHRLPTGQATRCAATAATGVRPARGVARSRHGGSDLLDLDGVRHLVRQGDVLVARDEDGHPAAAGLVSTVTRALGTTPASLSRVIRSMSP